MGESLAAVADEAAGLARFRGTGGWAVGNGRPFDATERTLRRLGRILIYASNQHEVTPDCARR